MNRFSVSLCLCAFALCLLLFLSPITAQQSTTDDLLHSMTLEQKVAQMFMVSLFGEQLTDVGREFLATWQPGAIVLLKGNTGAPEATTRLTNDLQQTVVDGGGIPMFIAIDQEGGIIAHLDEGFTTFPVPMLLTATGDPDLAYRVGQAMADEMLAVGVNMNLAPVADLNTNLANPIIGRRSFGTNIEMVAPILQGVIQGMQDRGVMGTAKHFPGHGDTDADSHITMPVVLHDRDRLDSVELAPFRATMAADVGTIMISHIWLPEIEPDEIPASLSRNVITRLLREEMGYEGLVITDALDMDAIDTVYTAETAALMAIEAGNDLIIPGAHVSVDKLNRVMQAVVDAVRSGDISEERIDESVRRILEAKERFGVLEWQPLDADSASEHIDSAAHIRLVQELFRAGVTVVYDKKSIIPLSGDVALIYPATRPSIQRECQTDAASIHPVGVSEYPNDEEISWARTAARQAESVVVFTMNAEHNVRQQALVRELPIEKTLVVALWSPYDRLALPDVAGYMVSYSPMLEAIPVVCELLTGRVQEHGRFPLSTAGILPADMGTE